MKFTLDWLYQYIDHKGMQPAELADRLTMLGLEVDSVTPLDQGIEEIIVARVVSVGKHPNADRLSLCQVDSGDGSLVQVVCGAPNVREGMLTAMALPGVTMPEGMIIKKAKVRGELSSGMLCSARELGLSKDHSGIMDLDTGCMAGQKLADALGLRDTVVEIDLTPNRADCASVLGIAREVAAVTGQTVRPPVVIPPALVREGLDYDVRIEEPELCPRYTARKLTNVTIRQSPQWLQQRLLHVGMRPINNIVDVTNFVMLEYGQPLHAFDFSRIKDKTIVVRCPSAHEQEFTTLDGVTRTLRSDMLMICDGSSPIAVAGVMGGLNSEVSDSTTEVLLEAACFNPVSIRKTARQLNLPSEASYRFERGVDAEGVLLAMERAVNLIVDVSGATAEPGGVDLYPCRKEAVEIVLRTRRVNELLGLHLEEARIISYLQAIECQVLSTGNGQLRVQAPSFRIDLAREVDLVEEIARLVGYNEIPLTMPTVAMASPHREPLRVLREQLGRILPGLGFSEAINYSFSSERYFDQLALAFDDPRRVTVTLLNPLSEDQAVLRTTLLPGLLENIRHNFNYQQTDLRFYEIGRVFWPDEYPQPEERMMLGAVLTGRRLPDVSSLHNTAWTDLLDVKGVAEVVLRQLGIQGKTGGITFLPGDCAEPYAAPGCHVILMDGAERIGVLGKLAETVARNFSFRQEVYFLEMDLSLLNRGERLEKKFSSLPKFPAVYRDIALLVPEATPAGDLLAAIRSYPSELIETADIFDVYAGDSLGSGLKSVALSVTYRSAEQTLADETVDIVHGKIVQSLMSSFDGRYRQG